MKEHFDDVIKIDGSRTKLSAAMEGQQPVLVIPIFCNGDRVSNPSSNPERTEAPLPLSEENQVHPSTTTIEWGAQQDKGKEKELDRDEKEKEKEKGLERVDEKGKEKELPASSNNNDMVRPATPKKGSGRRGVLSLASARTARGDNIDWYKMRLAQAEERIKELEARELEMKQKMRELKQRLKAAEGRGLIKSLKRVSTLFPAELVSAAFSGWNHTTTTMTGMKKRRNSLDSPSSSSSSSRSNTRDDSLSDSPTTRRLLHKTNSDSSVPNMRTRTIPEGCDSPSASRTGRWTIAKVNEHDRFLQIVSQKPLPSNQDRKRLRATALSITDVKAYFGDEAALSYPIKTGESLLHLECEKAVPKNRVIRFLASQVDINQVDKAGWTALHCLCKASARLKLIKILIHQGADVNATTKDGTTALHYLVCRNPSESKMIQKVALAVDTILQKGGNINKPNTHGETPAFHAVSYGNLELLLILITKGANINHRSSLGASLLHYAVAAQKVDTVARLIKLGLSPFEEGCTRGTAVDLARKTKGPKAKEIVHLCEEAKKKSNKQRTMSWRKRAFLSQGITRPQHATSFLTQVLSLSQEKERVQGERLAKVKDLIDIALGEVQESLDRQRGILRTSTYTEEDEGRLTEYERRLRLYCMLTEEENSSTTPTNSGGIAQRLRGCTPMSSSELTRLGTKGTL